MLRLDILREKAGCAPECSVKVTYEEKLNHNGTLYSMDEAEPEWVTVIIRGMVADHARPVHPESTKSVEQGVKSRATRSRS